jgi:DNA modification methylase
MPSVEMSRKSIDKFVNSVRSIKPVSGLTHNFYTYPARFSPEFARAAIKHFSSPGDLVLDPYMGGGTSIIEALVANRKIVGNDLNSLAVFIAKVKTTPLNQNELDCVRNWADEIVPLINYTWPHDDLCSIIDKDKTINLNIIRGRFLKKAIAIAIRTIENLPNENTKNFVKCALLKTSKWALDGRKKHTSLSEFRKCLSGNTHEMLYGLHELCKSVRSFSHTLIEGDAAKINKAPIFTQRCNRADLVITSPPYPGVHVLYHRWQVDGRHETPAPYWIAGCEDGEAESYYNFGSRHQYKLQTYFDTSLNTLKSIREVMRDGAFIVQMISFNDPRKYLPLYLQNMEKADFEEIFPTGLRKNGAARRIWRQVPNRRWHASLQGKTSSSREVVIVHRAI